VADLELDERIHRIVDLMLSAEWRTGASHLEFAAKYGVAVNTVQQWAAQASRFIRMCRGNEDDIRTRILANLEHAGKLALEAQRHWTTKGGDECSADTPDVRGYVATQELQARLLGLLEKRERDPSVELSTDELAELLRANGYEVTRKEPDADRATERKEEGK
jgi:hypothetical protein